mgnify:CR=1 FL=1
MNEFVKDAPCLCKEDWQEEAKTTMKLSFGEKIQFHLLRLQKSRFSYPVMYDDGTVSTMECDKIGRTPIGVVFENHLLSLKVSQNEMPWKEALEYCKSIKLLGKGCEAGTAKFWNNLNEQIKSNINAIFSSLGGEILGVHLCWTSTDYGNDNHFKARYWYNGIGGRSKDELHSVRPVLDLSKVSL